jgi:Uncharacterized protein, putative amidase
MSMHHIDNMTWVEYRDLVSASGKPLLVPVGSIEQHGPHLPLATDALIPEAVCEAVAKLTGAVVGASLTYGSRSTPRSGGGQHFCGTTSLDASTLIAQVRDLVREFSRHRVKGVAFIAGHMENTWVLNEACELALRDARAEGHTPPLLMSVGYWEFLDAGTIDAVFGEQQPNWPLEHAGVVETSIMLHLHPDAVHMDRLVDHPPMALPVYDLWPYREDDVPADGVLDSARGARAEHGKLFFDSVVKGLASAVQREFFAGDE